jgi:hypothetical protein
MTPGSPGASSRRLLQLDRPEAVTKYKLVISIKGIMIHVSWEKIFKSMEADYNNHLASPLVASSGETSPSPRIRCGKIKLPRQRCQFLGTQKQATPRM